MKERDLKFDIPGTEQYSLPVALAARLTRLAASMNPPRSLTTLMIQLGMDALDHAPEKGVVFQWPPPRETR